MLWPKSASGRSSHGRSAPSMASASVSMSSIQGSASRSCRPGYRTARISHLGGERLGGRLGRQVVNSLAGFGHRPLGIDSDTDRGLHESSDRPSLIRVQRPYGVVLFRTYGGRNPTTPLYRLLVASLPFPGSRQEHPEHPGKLGFRVVSLARTTHSARSWRARVMPAGAPASGDTMSAMHRRTVSFPGARSVVVAAAVAASALTAGCEGGAVSSTRTPVVEEGTVTIATASGLRGGRAYRRTRRGLRTLPARRRLRNAPAAGEGV